MRLILEKKPGPFRLRRQVTFGSARIDFEDRLDKAGAHRVDAVTLTSSFTAIHMGSAKYFHANELRPQLKVPTRDLHERLNRDDRAAVAFSVTFAEGKEPEVIVR